MITVIFSCFMLLLHFQITEVCRYLIFYKLISSSIILESLKLGHYHQLTRIITSNLFHNSLHHILINLIGFINIGIPLEDFFNSLDKYLYFKILLLIMILSGVLLVIFNYFLYLITSDITYHSTFSCGFSSVIFGLQFIFYYLMVGDFKTALQTVLLNLLFIHLVVPNVSTVGHFSGLCSGIITSKLIGL